ncbi:double-stranded RNA-binding protein Staufen homolog 2-like isoform X2 [Limulus polyphemus]|uniref:Double-stranded RNA-binding protein Staufen homolog 2-like isoform X2 n=1 Tax=Limulus polyphemus TaxID=6850 RepID=A0ABM1S5H0_LIMPO|nr:double-stranded RNA-binding protein Staufen homolog 2-like isoform X2 [Limulus polyphemus]
MNPTSVTSLIKPQSIPKSTGSGMMPGVTVHHSIIGGSDSNTLSISGHVITHVNPLVGPMGDTPLTIQGSGLRSVNPNLNNLTPNKPTNTISSTGPVPISTAPPAGGGSSQPTETMANTKEKTPMCLVNELARFNKVQHQYRLIDQSGPAHKKNFTVVLKLDNEEYTATGPSIKKAQHAAAAVALDKTALKHPPPKCQIKNQGPMTPTVELNALAMKRGEPAIYQIIEPPRSPFMPNFNFRGMYNQRYHYPKVPPTCYVALKVGNSQFFGEGITVQAARHAAAEEALRALKEIPLPENVTKHNEVTKSENETPELDQNIEIKSPISLVHEVALKRGFSVNFEVTRESGPPHMRTFVTRCTVGELVTEGEGNGKKVSKKKAAEKMLEELRLLPPLPVMQQKVKKKPVIKKKGRNLIKIQQAKKEREPIYAVIAERGEPRQREFLMQCVVGNYTTKGSGPNKKTAKRNAADAMLQLMGYSRPLPGKPAIKPSTARIEDGHMFQSQEIEKRKVTFLEHDVINEKLDGEGKLGRQLVPGLLLMPDTTGLTGDQPPGQGYTGLNRAPGGPLQHQEVVNKMTIQKTSAIAKELLDCGASPTAEALSKSGPKTAAAQTQTTVRPKQQLMYLAEVLGFQVHFRDFPKGNKMEYLSLVSLSTNPPHVSHGSGPTIDTSHDQAALSALRSLAELGLDSVTEGVKAEHVNISPGDGYVNSNMSNLFVNSNDSLSVSTMGSSKCVKWQQKDFQYRRHISNVQGTAPKLACSPTSNGLGSNVKPGASVSVTVKGEH